MNENENKPQSQDGSMMLTITNLLLVVLILVMGFIAYYVKNFIDGTTTNSKKSIPVVQIQEPVKKVTACLTYSVGATSQMDCHGDYSGKNSMQGLYKDGWKYISNISGTNKFVLVFEK